MELHEGHYSFRNGSAAQQQYFLPDRMTSTLATLIRQPFDPYGNYEHSYNFYHMQDLSTDPEVPEKSPMFMGRVEFSKSTDGPISKYSMKRTIQGNVNFRNTAQPVSITKYRHGSFNDLFCTFANQEPVVCDYQVERNTYYPELADMYHLKQEKELNHLMAHRTKGYLLLTNLSIIDAVQKLSVTETEPNQPILFDYLENFSYVKPWHELKYAGSIIVQFDGKPTKLQSYCQIGNGILPTFYWVTAQGLLVYVRFGISFWILNQSLGNERAV